jgi:hypothetical protein
MPKQAYISITDSAWGTCQDIDFERLKTGYVHDGIVKYKVTSGIPRSAKLNMIIYVFEDESLPNIPANDLFKQPPWTIKTERI